MANAGPGETYPKWMTADGIHAFSFKEKNGPVVVYDMQEALNKRYGVVASCKDFSVRHENATFCFVSRESKAAFEANLRNEDGPNLVQFGGRCAGALSRGKYTVLGNPTTAYVYEGKLYVWGRKIGRDNFIALIKAKKDIYLAKAELMFQVGVEFGKIVPNPGPTTN